jgi:hypothetical protein
MDWSDVTAPARRLSALLVGTASTLYRTSPKEWVDSALEKLNGTPRGVEDLFRTAGRQFSRLTNGWSRPRHRRAGRGTAG